VEIIPALVAASADIRLGHQVIRKSDSLDQEVKGSGVANLFGYTQNVSSVANLFRYTQNVSSRGGWRFTIAYTLRI